MTGATPVSARSLVDHLRRHYIKPGADLAGGVFLPEVGLNGITDRRCDAIYIGFTSASGRLLVGHEIKVSRADWRHELDQPGKADRWADQCHAWYVVAPSTSIVPPNELPAGWGLMVPSARSKNRMDIVVRARIHADREPSWLVTRSIIARLDTLQQQERSRMRLEERDRASEALAASRQARAEHADPRAAHDRAILDELEQLLGVRFRLGTGAPTSEWNLRIDPNLFGEAVAIARSRQALRDHYSERLDIQAQQLRKTADRLTELHQLVNQPLPTAVTNG